MSNKIDDSTCNWWSYHVRMENDRLPHFAVKYMDISVYEMSNKIDDCTCNLWSYHVRMENDRLPHFAVKYKPQGQR